MIKLEEEWNRAEKEEKVSIPRGSGSEGRWYGAEEIGLLFAAVFIVPRSKTQFPRPATLVTEDAQ